MYQHKSWIKSLQQQVISLCPIFQKSLFVTFFALMFSLSHYFILVVCSIKDMGMWKHFLFLLAIWLIFNIIFNYVMAILVQPGTPTDIPMNILFEIKHNCKKCGVIKPPRSHHCSICNRCIIQMDHHCPWIGGCVGHHNRKYFMNFLTYTTAGLTQMLLLMVFDNEPMIYTLVLTLLLCLGGFSIFHWILVLKGKSSLQVCWQDPRYQPSDSMAFNLQLVYGTSNIFICLLPQINILTRWGDTWNK